MATAADGRSQFDGGLSMLRSVWSELQARGQDNDDEWAPPSPLPCERANCCASSIEEHESSVDVEKDGASKGRFQELPRNSGGLFCTGVICEPVPPSRSGPPVPGQPLDEERCFNLLDSFGVNCRIPQRESTMRFDTPREHILQQPASPGFELHEVTLEYRWDELSKATGGFSHASVVGSGNAGTVYRGVLEDSLPVAAKVLHNSSGEVFANSFEEEVRLLARCHHPNIAMLLGFAQDTRGTRKRALVYELLPKGSLHSRLHVVEQPFPWRERLRAAVEVSRGLAHMHRLRPEVLHRDIKSANILFDEYGTAKIADFCLACCQELSGDDALGGTPGYVAPEFQETKATQATEVYAMGMVLLELLTARLPMTLSVDGANAVYLRHEVRPEESGASVRVSGILDRSAGWPSSTVGGVAELAPKCIHSNPKRRPTFSEMVAVLQGLATPSAPTSPPKDDVEAPNSPAEAGHGARGNPLTTSKFDWADVGTTAPAPRKNRLNLAEAYAQVELAEPEPKTSPTKAEAVQQDASPRNIGPLEYSGASKEDQTAGEGKDGGEDSALAKTQDASATDVLAAAAERLAQAEPDAEQTPAGAAQVTPSGAFGKIARAVTERFVAPSTNVTRVDSEVLQHGSPSAAPSASDEAGGRLDGRWITTQQGKENTIDGARVTWKSGTTWTLEKRGADLFSVTVGVQTYHAQLSGNELVWDDGDVWTRQPAEADGPEPAGIATGWNKVRSIMGAGLAKAPGLAAGLGGAAAARDAGELAGGDDISEPLTSDDEYEEPNKPERFGKIKGLFGAALGGGAGQQSDAEQPAQLGARALFGASAQLIQRMRPLDAVTSVQQKFMQGTGGAPGAVSPKNSALPEEQRAEEAATGVPKEVTGSSIEQALESCSSSERVDGTADHEAVKSSEPDYSALAGLRLHHITEFIE